MKVTASGGTDAASIVLFWPDNLPEGADVVLQDDPMALVEELRGEGKLIWFPCDSDGGYTVAIFVRCEVPEDLRALCRDEERYPTLLVRGVGYFGGAEYMFKATPGLLEKYPHMCGQVVLPEGSYSARVYSTEIPETLFESWLVEQAGATAKRIWDVQGFMAGCAVAGVLASLFALIVASWTVWSAIAATTATCIVAAMALARTKMYTVVARAKDAFEETYPSYVVHLQ
jgi:hypothetical protein